MLFCLKKRLVSNKIFRAVLIALMLLVTSKTSVFAASLTKTTVRYDRMKVGSQTNVLVTFVPTTNSTEDRVRITFAAGTGINVGATLVNTNLGTGVTQLPGVPVIGVSGQDVTITGITNLTVGTTYGFNISVGVSTSSTPGQVYDIVSTLNGVTVIDQTKVASRFISDDQIVINATVPPTFSFVLSGNTDTFTGDLNPGAVVSTLGKTVTVTTNANKGWIGWIKSNNMALSSVTTGESIGTTGTVDGVLSTCITGTDCYIFDAQKTTTGTGTGALTVDPEYAGNGTTSGGTFANVLTPFISRSGKTNGDVITMYAHATITAMKAAASDYTDTWTIIGAGNF